MAMRAGDHGEAACPAARARDVGEPDWIVSHESQQNWHMSGADPDGISSVLTRSEKQLWRVGLGVIGDRPGKVRFVVM